MGFREFVGRKLAVHRISSLCAVLLPSLLPHFAKSFSVFRHSPIVERPAAHRSRKVWLLLHERKRESDQLGPSASSTETSLADKKIEFALHQSIDSISAESWNSFLIPNVSSPFMEHSWLQCLEQSRCAAAETGWGPQHVSVTMDGNVIAYVPLYIKGHSMVSHHFSCLMIRNGP